MMSKYGNRKMKAPDGQVFDSVKEYHRWGCLRLLERAGKISNLQRQVKYVLVPAQRDQNGKLIEREVSYYADFVYIDNAKGTVVVEDVKGVRTDLYKCKKKLLLWVHGIRIIET
jgi:hypothetical protein